MKQNFFFSLSPHYFAQIKNICRTSACWSGEDGSHLGDLLPTHEEHEDDSQDDAQADQNEGSVGQHVLLGDDGVELRGRGVVDEDALKETTNKNRTLRKDIVLTSRLNSEFTQKQLKTESFDLEFKNVSAYKCKSFFFLQKTIHLEKKKIIIKFI